MAIAPSDIPCPGAEPNQSITDLFRRAQSGSAPECRALYHRCRKPLLAVIRQVIRPRLRQLYDSDDFLSETFLQIFTTYFNDEILSSPEALWSYFKRIAENKVRDANRKYLLSLRHDVSRNISLENLAPEQRDQCLSTRTYSPEECLLLKELVEDRLAHLVRGLPLLMRAIVQLVLAGVPAPDIAAVLKLETRHVYRAMDWVKKSIRE
jgi:DNA-directed RNA polymerase specialized sigma24 family protein